MDDRRPMSVDDVSSSNGNHDMDMVDLKSLIKEMYHGLDFENLSTKGAYTHLKFKSTKYKSDFFYNLKELHESNKFCDVLLKINDSGGGEVRAIRAHKLVLASASPYFRAMFAGGFRENISCQEVSIDPQISYSVLKSIIEFIYTSEIIIKDYNVQELLVAAKILQIEEIVNSCSVYLCMNIDSSNCFAIEDFAKSYGCVELAKKCQKYMTEHFCDIINSEEFLSLNEKQLCSLLSKDELSVRCESVVFKAVVDWVKHEPEKRRKHLDHLFQCVRFHFLPPKFLKDQMKHNEIFKLKDTDKSRQYLQQVCDELIAHKPCTTATPRKPALTFALFVIGGYQRQSINLVECCKKSTMSWEKCAEMRVPRSGVCCVSLALYIYCIGGRNNNLHGNTDCSDVECYDPFVNAWKRCASMSVPRSRAGAAVIDALIYACGGASGAVYHSSVERYYPQDNRWETVCPMIMPRIGLGCAVVNRLLYAIGGYDGVIRLNQVECYNPDQNVWFMVAPMNTARSGAGVCAIENFIYAIGGYTTSLQLSSCERYDTITNQWTYIKSMSMPRSALACVAWNGKIFAIGGYNGNEFLSSIEYYEPSEDKWDETVNLTSERSGHGAAVTVESKFN